MRVSRLRRMSSSSSPVSRVAVAAAMVGFGWFIILGAGGPVPV